MNDAPELSSFRLLDLPVELVQRVCIYVALQRYDYAASRRPRPSPLRSLASSHSTLHQLASPLLWRRRNTARKTDDVEGSLLRNGRHVAALELDLTAQGSSPPPLCEHQYLPAVTSLELRCGTRTTYCAPFKLNFANLKTLSIRHGRGLMSPSFDFTPRITNLAIAFCVANWLYPLAALPNLTHLSTSLTAYDPPLRHWLNSRTLNRVESLVLDLPPSTSRSFLEQPKGSLERFVRGLVMPDSAPLRHLEIVVRREPASFGDFSSRDRIDLRLTVKYLKAFAGIQSLMLDEWTVANAAAVGALAEAFPRLTTLYFGPGTVWKGTKEEHLVALAQFPHLETLECPRWPEEAAGEELVEEEALAMEVALALPTLTLFAVVGQQSERQWRRIGRDASGIQVDRVTFYNTDLDRL